MENETTHPLLRLKRPADVIPKARMPAPRPALLLASTASRDGMIPNDVSDMFGRPWWSSVGDELAKPTDDDDLIPGEVKGGHPRLFGDADDLLSRCRAYLDYCMDRPFVIDKIVNTKAGIIRVPEFKPRSPTKFGLIAALGSHLGVIQRMLAENTPCGRVMQFIYGTLVDVKIAGAQIGVWNSNLTAREIGLADKVETVADIQLGPREDPAAFADKPSLVHPDDPQPDNPTVLFTAAQIAAGVAYPIRTVSE